jgi:hypothetical protein
MSMLHLATCLCLHVHVACPYLMSMLHVLATSSLFRLGFICTGNIETPKIAVLISKRNTHKIKRKFSVLTFAVIIQYFGANCRYRVRIQTTEEIHSNMPTLRSSVNIFIFYVTDWFQSR